MMFIPLFDERDLSQFFAREAPAPSHTGIVLERARLYIGEVLDTGELTPGARADIERKNRERARLRKERRARGRTGSHEVFPLDELPETVGFTSSLRLHPSPPPMPDEGRLQKTARIRRRLDWVRRHGAESSYGVLQLYYGDLGAYFDARDQPRLCCLWHVTVGGQKLLKKADDVIGKGLDGMRPYEQMATHVLLGSGKVKRDWSQLTVNTDRQVRDQATSRYHALAHLFAQAEREAIGLYSRACDDWAASAEAERARRETGS